jgi:hypothetical protein
MSWLLILVLVLGVVGYSVFRNRYHPSKSQIAIDIANEPRTGNPTADFVRSFLKYLHPYLASVVNPDLYLRGREKELKVVIKKLVEERLSGDKVPMGHDLQVKLLDEIVDLLVGYGPLDAVLRDGVFDQVEVSAFDRVMITRGDQTEIRGFIDLEFYETCLARLREHSEESASGLCLLQFEGTRFEIGFPKSPGVFPLVIRPASPKPG